MRVLFYAIMAWAVAAGVGLFSFGLAKRFSTWHIFDLILYFSGVCASLSFLVIIASFVGLSYGRVPELFVASTAVAVITERIIARVDR